MKAFALTGLVLGTGAAAGLWLTAARGLDPQAQAAVAAATGDAEAGRLVFHAAGCASCHTAEGAEWSEAPVLSGGQAFATDFGTFHAPNISMDAQAGIGGWTLAQFADAVQAGVSPGGAHYYPAFPYSAYRLATPQDVADLWSFWQDLPVSDAANLPHDLGFPFSIRRTLGLWKLIALPGGWFSDPPATLEAERGRYLAEALAHCGECHSPRRALGAIDTSAWLEGAPNPSGRGNIPGITPDQLGWSAEEIANYLNDGFTPEFDSAGGHMARVVLNLNRLPAEDREAIAAYLLQIE